MWKESYRIGIDIIDNQHIELFQRTDELLEAINSNADAQRFRETINFLKNYVVQHFHDEEEYQASIGYSELEIHKKAHSDFVKLVFEYEKRLEDSNYNIKVVKELAGTLTAWLIYHVADVDQKIVRNKTDAATDKNTYFGSFSSGILYVLEKMAGLGCDNIRKYKPKATKMKGDIFIQIELLEHQNKKVIFGFSKELAFKLFEIMTFTIPNSIDELVYSMLSELTNIVSGNAATNLAQMGVVCDITPPIILSEQVELNNNCEAITINTNVGELEVAILY